MISDESFEPAIFVLQRLQALRIADLEVAVRLLPVVHRRPRETVAPDEVAGSALAAGACRIAMIWSVVKRDVFTRPPVDATVDYVGTDCPAHFGGNSGGTLIGSSAYPGA